MMISVSQIICKLESANNNINNHIVKLEKQKCDIQEIVSQIQAELINDSKGVEASAILNSTLQKLNVIQSDLSNTRQEINNYIQLLQR